jgi:hypothetical protein
MGSFQTFLFGDRKDDAAAAFEKISTAMKEWRRFKNDSSETVEISDITGTSVLRLEHLASVSLNNETREAEQIKWAEYNGRLHAAQKRAEAAAGPAAA